MSRILVSLLISSTIACSAEPGLQNPPLDSAPMEGRIAGRITDATGQPIVAAVIHVEPGDYRTKTDVSGNYSIDVPLIDEAGSYILAVSHDDYITVTSAIVLETSTPMASFDLEMSRRDRDPPLEILDIHQYVPPGQWPTGPILEYTVDIGNQGTTTMSGLVLTDTLDAAHNHAMSLEDITINRDAFPSAVVTLGVDGRSFWIDLGTLEPTQNRIRAFVLSVPTPEGDGLFCNRVYSAAEADGQSISDIAIDCVATTLSASPSIIPY